MKGVRAPFTERGYGYKPAEGKARKFLGMRLREDELAAIVRAALVCGGTAPASWAREILLREAGRVLKPKT